MTARVCKELLAQWLADGSFAERVPEVAALRGVPQPPEYHGEGDAYAHTLFAVEAVADDADPRVFWGALLHDIGKARTTELTHGHWHSYGHEAAGAQLAQAIMARLGFPELADDVAWLVRHHDFLLSWQLKLGAKLTPRQRRFTQHPLFPLLLKVSAADAAASWGKSRKGEDGRLLEELLADKR
jgi:putative nucleotidyltransferase with HDIG domain